MWSCRVVYAVALTVECRRVCRPGTWASSRTTQPFLTDWHAWVNDKFDRDMEKINLASEYMKAVFRVALSNPEEGVGPGQLQFISASKLMDSGKYWERVLRCSKNMSLSRVRRTFRNSGKRRCCRN